MAEKDISEEARVLKVQKRFAGRADCDLRLHLAMKPGFALCLLLGASLLQLSRAARAQDSFSSYQNARYGTMVRFPSNLVAPQPESANGDGRKFVSRDRQIELTIYAGHNIFSRSVSGEMRRALADWKADGATLTYYRGSTAWFVISGFLGGDIFYEKTLLQNGVFHTMIWRYPKSLKKRLDASVSRSVASFSVGQGLETPVPPPRTRPQISTSHRTASNSRRPASSSSSLRKSPPVAASKGY